MALPRDERQKRLTERRKRHEAAASAALDTEGKTDWQRRWEAEFERNRWVRLSNGGYIPKDNYYAAR